MILVAMGVRIKREHELTSHWVPGARKHPVVERGREICPRPLVTSALSPEKRFSSTLGVGGVRD
jgi:hypothetical protein